MYRSSPTPAVPRSAPALAGLAAMLTLTLAAASPTPLRAQSELFFLDTIAYNSGVGNTAAEAPLVASLGDGRFVTAQRIASSPLTHSLELRSWKIGPTGDIMWLNTHTDPFLGHQEITAVTALGTTGFATALRPSPGGFVHLVTWNVSSTGLISKADDHPGMTGADGEVDLVTLPGANFSSYRILGVHRQPGNARQPGITVLSRWDVVDGQVSALVAVWTLEDSTERAIDAHNGAHVAVVLRRLSGELRLVHFTFDSTTGQVDHQSSATGPPVTDVDVAYTGSGRMVTAARLPAGQLEVAAWTELTFPPSGGKFLYSPASARTRDAVSAISIAPLMYTKVVTAVIDGTGYNDVIAWDSNALVGGGLHRLQGFPASNLSFTHVGWDELVAVAKSGPWVFRATAWTDLMPQ